MARRIGLDMGMIVIGAEQLEARLKAEPFRQHKALLNETGIVIFPVSVQHSTVKIEGISYEDDSAGNALALIFDASKCEIRGHRDFSDTRVSLLWKELLKHPEAAAFRGLTLTYQGRPISP